MALCVLKESNVLFFDLIFDFDDSVLMYATIDGMSSVVNTLTPVPYSQFIC